MWTQSAAVCASRGAGEELHDERRHIDGWVHVVALAHLVATSNFPPLVKHARVAEDQVGPVQERH